MIKIIFFAVLALLVFSPFWRMFFRHLFEIYFHAMKDTALYFIERKYEKFPYFGIDLFCGLFGHGKTLSISHRCEQIYKAFGKDTLFISNYHLENIPYVELTNFKQLVQIGEDENAPYKNVVVCIDEVETVLNNRNYANFPLEMLTPLCQMRKRHMYIMASSPRFFQVDKLFRTLCTNVFLCDKFWRFQHCQAFDAWDLEQGQNHHLIKRVANIWWFVRDKDYNSYNTEQMISKTMASDFISNDESIQRKGLDAMSNADAIMNPSRKLKKRRKLNK